MSKRLGGIIGSKYKTSSWHLEYFDEGSLQVIDVKDLKFTIYNLKFTTCPLRLIYISESKYFKVLSHTVSKVKWINRG